MSSKLRFLLWFANENVDFRLPEITSIIKLFKLDVVWVTKPNLTPFWIVDLQSEKDALKIASRSVTLRSVLKLWGHSSTLEGLHNTLKGSKELMAPYLQPHLSFKVQVETFGKTFTMKDKVQKIELFSYLPVCGPVKMNNPDVTLFYIEDYGLDPNNAPENPFQHFFGVWMCDGRRDLISKLSLKRRTFLGNTSMDPQLSLLMANQAMVQPGDLVLDPFVGTGSLLVASACFGAYVLGMDIDYLMLHGRTRPTRKQDRGKLRAEHESVYSNLEQYDTGHQYVDVVVGDSSLPLWHERLKLDAILADPPYGVREATERVGTFKECYTVSEKHLATHVPSKVEYGLRQIYRDLLRFAADHLRVGGRLVSWMPVNKSDYSEEMLPRHVSLTLVANSEQTLTVQTSRRLLTWEKTREPPLPGTLPHIPDTFSNGFREHYFGQGETRKQKKERIARELEARGIVYKGRSQR